MADWKQRQFGKGIRDLLSQIQDSGIFKEMLEKLKRDGEISLKTFIDHHVRLAKPNTSGPAARLCTNGGDQCGRGSIVPNPDFEYDC